MRRATAMWMMAAVAACGHPADKPAARGATAAAKPVLRMTYGIDGNAGMAGRAAEIMQRRLERLGVAATARRDGLQIEVELPALEPEVMWRVREVIVRTGHLTFHVVDDGAAPMLAIAQQADKDLEAAAQRVRSQTDAWKSVAGGQLDDRYLVADDRDEQLPIEEARRHGCVHPDTPTTGGSVTCRVTGRQVLDRYLDHLRNADPTLAIPDDRMVHFERVSPSTWRTYYTVRAPALAGWTIAAAEARDDGFGPQVQITLDPIGARAFAEVTAAHVGHKLAIVLDDHVMSAPVIESQIKGGKLSLVAADRAEAENLAIVLATGALPAPVVEVASEAL